MNLEVTKSTFQALASKFVLDRDSAIANINKLLYSEGDNIDELYDQMSKLTISKINIANTQEELNRVVRLHDLSQEKKVFGDDSKGREEPADSINENRPE